MPGRPSGAKDSHKRASRQQKTASEYLKLAQIAEARESKEKKNVIKLATPSLQNVIAIAI